MIGSDFLIAELARIAYIDGHQDGIKGMIGVAETIRHRQQVGWYGGDWHKILANHWRTRATIEVDLALLPDPRSFAFMQFLQEVPGIFHGYKEDSVTVLSDALGAQPKVGLLTAQKQEPSLYYGRIDKIDNPWFLENISRVTDKHHIVAQVGLLHFWS